MKDFFHNVDIPVDSEDDSSDTGNLIRNRLFALQQFTYFAGIPIGVIALRNTIAKQRHKILKEAEQKFNEIETKRNRDKSVENPFWVEESEWFPKTNDPISKWKTEGDPKLRDLIESIQTEDYLKNKTLEEITGIASEQLNNEFAAVGSDLNARIQYLADLDKRLNLPFSKALQKLSGFDPEVSTTEAAHKVVYDQLSHHERMLVDMFDEFSTASGGAFSLEKSKDGAHVLQRRNAKGGRKLAFNIIDKQGNAHGVALDISLGADIGNPNLYFSSNPEAINRIKNGEPVNLNLVEVSSTSVKGFVAQLRLRGGKHPVIMTGAQAYTDNIIKILSRATKEGLGVADIKRIVQDLNVSARTAAITDLGLERRATIQPLKYVTEAENNTQIMGQTTRVKTAAGETVEVNQNKDSEARSTMAAARAARQRGDSPAYYYKSFQGILTKYDMPEGGINFRDTPEFQDILKTGRFKGKAVPQKLLDLLKDTSITTFQTRALQFQAILEKESKQLHYAVDPKFASEILGLYTNHYNKFNAWDPKFKLTDMWNPAAFPGQKSGQSDVDTYMLRMLEEEKHGISVFGKTSDPQTMQRASQLGWMPEYNKRLDLIEKRLETGDKFGISLKTSEAFGVSSNPGQVAKAAFNKLEQQKNLVGPLPKTRHLNMKQRAFTEALQDVGGSRTLTFEFNTGKEKIEQSLVFKGESLARSDAFHAHIVKQMSRIETRFLHDWKENGLTHASAVALKSYKRILNVAAGFKATPEGSKIQGLDELIEKFKGFISHVDANKFSNSTRIHTSGIPSPSRAETYYPGYRISAGKKMLSSSFGKKVYEMNFSTLYENPVDYLAPMLHATDTAELESIKKGFTEYYPSSRNYLRTIMVTGNTHTNPMGGAVDYVRAAGDENPLRYVMDRQGTMKIHYKKGEVASIQFEHSGGAGTRVTIGDPAEAKKYLLNIKKRFAESIKAVKGRMESTGKDYTKETIGMPLKEGGNLLHFDIELRRDAQGNYISNSFVDSLTKAQTRLNISDDEYVSYINYTGKELVGETDLGKGAKDNSPSAKAAFAVVTQEQAADTNPKLMEALLEGNIIQDPNKGTTWDHSSYLIVNMQEQKGNLGRGIRVMNQVNQVHNDTMNLTLRAAYERSKWKMRSKGESIKGYNMELFSRKLEGKNIKYTAGRFKGRTVSLLEKMHRKNLTLAFFSLVTPYEADGIDPGTGAAYLSRSSIEGIKELSSGKSMLSTILKNKGMRDAYLRASKYADYFDIHLKPEPVMIGKKLGYKNMLILKKSTLANSHPDNLFGFPQMYQIKDKSESRHYAMNLDVTLPNGSGDIDIIRNAIKDKDSYLFPIQEGQNILDAYHRKFSMPRRGIRTKAQEGERLVKLIVGFGQAQGKKEQAKDHQLVSSLLMEYHGTLYSSMAGPVNWAQFYPKGANDTLKNQVKMSMRDLMLLRFQNPAAASQVVNQGGVQDWANKELMYQQRLLAHGGEIATAVKGLEGTVKFKSSPMFDRLFHAHKELKSTTLSFAEASKGKNPFLEQSLTLANDPHGDGRTVKIAEDIQTAKFLGLKRLMDQGLEMARGGIPDQDAFTKLIANFSGEASAHFNANTMYKSDYENIVKNVERTIKENGSQGGTLKLVLQGLPGMEETIKKLEGKNTLLDMDLGFNKHNIDDVLEFSQMGTKEGYKHKLVTISKGSSNEISMKFLKFGAALDYLSKAAHAYKDHPDTKMALQMMTEKIIKGFYDSLDSSIAHIRDHGAGKGSMIYNRAFHFMSEGTQTMFRQWNTYDNKHPSKTGIKESAELAMGHVTMSKRGAIGFLMGISRKDVRLAERFKELTKSMAVVKEAVDLTGEVKSKLWQEIKSLEDLSSLRDKLLSHSKRTNLDFKDLEILKRGIQKVDHIRRKKNSANVLDTIRHLEDPGSKERAVLDIYDEALRRVELVKQGKMKLSLTMFRQPVHVTNDFRQIFLRISDKLSDNQVYGSSVDIKMAYGDQDGDLVYYLSRGLADLKMALMPNEAKIAYAKNEVELLSKGILKERLVRIPANGRTFQALNYSTSRFLKNKMSLRDETYMHIKSAADEIDSHIDSVLSLYNLDKTMSGHELATHREVLKKELTKRLIGTGTPINEIFYIGNELARDDVTKADGYLRMRSKRTNNKGTAEKAHISIKGSYHLSVFELDHFIKSDFFADPTVQNRKDAVYKSLTTKLQKELSIITGAIGEDSKQFLGRIRGYLNPDASSLTKTAAGIPYKYGTFMNMTLEIGRQAWFGNPALAHSREALKAKMGSQIDFNGDIINYLQDNFNKTINEQLALQSKHGASNIVESFIKKFQTELPRLVEFEGGVKDNPFANLTEASQAKVSKFVKGVTSFRDLDVELSGKDAAVYHGPNVEGKAAGKIKFKEYQSFVRRRQRLNEFGMRAFMDPTEAKAGRIYTGSTADLMNTHTNLLDQRIATIMGQGGDQQKNIETFLKESFDQYTVKTSKSRRNYHSTVHGKELSANIFKEMARDIITLHAEGHKASHVLTARAIEDANIREGFIRIRQKANILAETGELVGRMTAAWNGNKYYKVMQAAASSMYEEMRGNGTKKLGDTARWIQKLADTSNDPHMHKAAIYGVSLFHGSTPEIIEGIYQIKSKDRFTNLHDSLDSRGIRLDRGYSKGMGEIKSVGTSALVGTFIAMGINQMLSGYSIPDLQRTAGKGGEYWEHKATKQSEMGFKPNAPRVEPINAMLMDNRAQALALQQQNHGAYFRSNQRNYNREQDFSHGGVKGVRIQ
jgi:hypothetical protein